MVSRDGMLLMMMTAGEFELEEESFLEVSICHGTTWARLECSVTRAYHSTLHHTTTLSRPKGSSVAYARGLFGFTFYHVGGRDDNDDDDNHGTYWYAHSLGLH